MFSKLKQACGVHNRGNQPKKKNRQKVGKDLKKKKSAFVGKEIANSKKPKFVKNRQIVIKKFQTQSGCQSKSMPTLKTK